MTRALFAAFALSLAACGGAQAPKPATGTGAATMEVPATDELDAEVYDIETEQVTFASGELELAGTLVRPKVEGKRPAVVIAHDFGVRGRDGLIGEVFGLRLPTEVPLYRTLAESLAARGVVVLIYDKRTCTKGSEPWCTYPEEYGKAPQLATALTQDLRNAAIWLAGRGEVASVALVGHGHGAELAAVASLDARVGRAALLQPPGEGLAGRARFQVEESIRQIDGRIAEVGDTPEADLLKQEKAKLEQVLAAPNPLQIAPETMADLDALHAQYLDILSSAGRPMFAIVGSVDPGEPPGSQQKLEKLLGDRLITIADLTRVMVSVSNDDDPTVVDAEVIARLSAFVGGVSAP